MARIFFLSCNGPLDDSPEAIEALGPQLSALIHDPRILDMLLSASVREPCRINTPKGTLAEARTMDAALMGLGIFSVIHVSDTRMPGKSGIFVSDRQGPRRTDPGQPAPAPSAIPEANPRNDKRGSRGRRAGEGDA